MSKVQLMKKWVKLAQERGAAEIRSMGIIHIEIDGDQWNEKVQIEDGDIIQCASCDGQRYVFFFGQPTKLTQAQCNRAAELDSLVDGLDVKDLIGGNQIDLDEFAANIGYLDLVLTPQELNELCVGSVDKTLAEVQAIYE